MTLVGDAFRAALTAMVRPTLWIPSTILSIASDTFVDYLEASSAPGTPPTELAIRNFVYVVLGRSWLTLSLMAVALAILRGQRANIWRNWVHVLTALEIGLVCGILLVPIAVGTLLLVVPGVYLMLLWSQVALVLIDDQARFFKAPNWSAALTDGYRWQILAVWVIVWAAESIGPWLLHGTDGTALIPLSARVTMGVDLALNAITTTFGIALAAAVYYQLSLRAPWQPEMTGSKGFHGVRAERRPFG